MYMHFSLQPSISQQLTPQLIQHLQLLQLNAVELHEMLLEKTLENPIIELVESKLEKPYDWLQFATSNKTSSQSLKEPLFVRKQDTKDFLFEQIPFTLSEKENTIIRYLIYSLDERLFLTYGAEEVAQLFDVSSEVVKQLVALLQTFEPLGVGASNAIEYVKMQILNDMCAPKLAYIFICKELKAVADLELYPLSKRYAVSIDEVVKTIDYLKSLPRTPTITGAETAPVAIPDVIVQQVDGIWFIEMNEYATSSIKTNDVYIELLKSNDVGYLHRCMRQYVTLVQGIDFRKKTLYAITDYIVTHQQRFLEEGVKALLPMGLRDVAEELSLHESTVSRAIKGKYMQTPFGTILMQQLFVKAVGNTTSSVIHEKIATWIAQEPKKKPYSDQQLVEMLEADGIDVSRRTVAKYREQLKIPSSKKRMHLAI